MEEIVARLKALENECRELGTLIENISGKLNEDYQRQIYELFLKKDELNIRVDEIGQLSGDVWADMKKGNELSWKLFRDSLDKISKSNGKETGRNSKNQ